MASFYQNILFWIRKHHLVKPVVTIAQISPYLIAGIYALSVIYTVFFVRELFINVLIRPLCAFIIVTIIRKIYDRPRPCITMHLTPLIGHKTGESFPSRHTVSAFSIALALFHLALPLGSLAMVIAVIVGLTRVICGLHHISDVIAAIIISLIIFWI